MFDHCLLRSSDVCEVHDPGPSHKRGPPKGYILAIERRLHQVEALLGTIIGSEDSRAKGLIRDLSQDELAKQIIQRVDVGPFGPKVRVAHPFGSTKEDFLASIMTGAGEEIQEASRGDGASPRFDNLALVSPSSIWQDNLQRLLSQTSGSIFPHTAGDVEHVAPGSPDPRTRRASFPLMANNPSARRVPPVSPMSSLPSLSSVSSAPHADRALWEKIDGLEKFDTESISSDDSEVKVSVRVEDAYIDGDAQLRIASRISGLQILGQCQKNLTGREDRSLYCPWPSMDAERSAGQLPAITSIQLPPEQHQHDLVRAFFEHVYPTFPVVNKTQFLRLYYQRLNTSVTDLCAFPDGLLTMPSRSVQPPLHATLDRTAFDVLLLSMFALSYRFVNASAEDPDYAQSLGLHRDTQALVTSGLVPQVDCVAREQTWAGCVIADGPNANPVSKLGRPIMTDPTESDVAPVFVSQVRLDNALHLQTDLGLGASRVPDSTVLTCFNASRALAAVVGTVLNQLYSIARPADTVLELRAKQLERQLSQWRQTLPAQVQLDASGSVPPACVLELHIRYWWTVILLYLPRAQGFASDIQSKALALCRDASTQLSALGKNMPVL
ncbi:hypothetical protein FOMPIDRAFT_46832 [Fomitopsis schrenkii]|uniref:Transcription factor domain-containing protein n=1 Tax=Fomitopsis schrenkii TaxID=2126942 RepID=S8FHB4_FOMSC|nr:hypothetical protein FOMPIDRAFT_46832 [Fomitopsis schrenkii]